MKIGIIGCGHIAEVHLRAIRAIPDVEVIGVVDAFEEYAKAFASRWGIPHVCKDTNKLIEEVKPDVVHILTPPASHGPIASMCLELGCHVLVEKPMAMDASETHTMVRLAKEKGLVLGVNHNYRFEPVLREAAHVFSSGRLGDLVSLDVSYGFDINRYPALLQEGVEDSHWIYRLPGGPLEDLMAHPASMVLEYLTQVNDVKVLSRNRGILPKPWSDEIRVILDAEPAHAEIYISYSIRPDSLILNLRGTEGTARADLGSMTLSVDAASVLPRAVTRGAAGFKRAFQEITGASANILNVARGKFDKTGGVKTVVEGFYHAITHQTDPFVTMDEGRRVVELIRGIWPESVRPLASTDSKLEVNETRGVGARSSRAKVLVTGASGFIGSHLVQRLCESAVPVRVLVRPKSYGLGFLKRLPLEIVEGDLSDLGCVHKAMDGIETVYHVGAAMSGDWEAHRLATVVGTQNVVDTALALGIEHLVHFSSLVAYRVTGVSDGTVIKEDWPLEDQAEKLGPYTRAKVEAERIVCEAFESKNLPMSIIRPGMVIGPRGRAFFPHLGYKLQDKVFIVLGSGNTVLPLVYIDHVISGAIACVGRSEAVGKAYNLVDDGNVTVLDYINGFRDAANFPVKIVKVPFILPYCATGVYEIAAAAGLLKKGVTSRRQLSWKHKTLFFPNERAKTDLGWCSEIPLQEAMTRTFDWYLSIRK